MGVITYRQSQTTFQRLVRWKKRVFLAHLEHDLYELFLSQEHSPPSNITSTEIWGQYATSLYTVFGQPPLRAPLESCPHTCSFFTAEMVRKAIDRMKIGRAHDHEGLVAEHFMHARDMLAELLAVMFNRAMYEGLPDTWSLSTIVSIFKAGNPTEPGNYRTIMIGHTLVRLYASILEQQLSTWLERAGLRAVG